MQQEESQNTVGSNVVKRHSHPAPQRYWLMVIAIMLGFISLGVWTRGVPSSAWGQEKGVSNSPSKQQPLAVDTAVAQRYEIINKLDQLNREVDEIAAVITNGQVKVVVIPDDKKSEGVRHEAATKP